MKAQILRNAAWAGFVVLALAACGVETRKAEPPAAASPNLIENGDFESYFPQTRPGRWKFEPEALFSWSSPSSGAGDRSVALDASRIPAPRSEKGASPAEASILAVPDPAAVKPGAAYLLEASFLRDRHLDGVYPSIELFGEPVRINDFWSAGAWQKIALLRKAPNVLPADRRVVKISFPAGDYRIRIDDLRLVEFTPRPIPDPSRISWTLPATDRLVEFRVRIALQRKDLEAQGPLGVDGRSVREFLSTNSDRHPEAGFAVPASAPGNRVAYSFDPNTRISPGKYEWRVAVRLGRTLISLSEPRPIIILPGKASGTGAPPDLTTVSEPPSGVTFPIGIYGAVPAEYRELAAAGFTAVQTSVKDGRSCRNAIAAAAAARLKILVNPPDPFPDIVEAAAAIKNIEGPGIVWYLEDEPEGRSVSPKILFDRRAALRAAGLWQPGAISLLRPWRTEDYAAAADVILSDPYPIPFEPLSWLGRCLDEIRETLGTPTDKHVWAVIQAFDWSSASPAAAATGGSRPPTFPEIRALAYLALIHRAEGLMFYPGGAGPRGLRARPDLWLPLKGLVAEINERFPILAFPESRQILGLSCPAADADGLPAVHALLKDAGSGRSVLLAVNTLGQTVEASFSVGSPPPAKAVRMVFGPYEVKVVRLSKF